MERSEAGMECRQARELLSPYLDGELMPPERGRLEEHLQSCPDCREELENLRRLAVGVRTLTIPELSPAFADRVMAALPQAPAALTAAPVADRRPWTVASGPVAWLAWLSVGNVVTAVLALLLVRPHLRTLWGATWGVARAVVRWGWTSGGAVQGWHLLLAPLVVGLLALCAVVVRRIASTPWPEEAL